MINIISIRKINGICLQDIEYKNFDDLGYQLKLLINKNDSDLYTQLLLNNDILNDFNIIDMLILSKLDIHDFITVVYCDKKELYCLDNNKGVYILKHTKDNYAKLLQLIILHCKNNSFNIIKNNSYRDLVLLFVKICGTALKYVSSEFQNDKEIVYEAIEQNGCALQYTNSILRNDREFVIKAIKQNGWALAYASIDLQNDITIVKKAIKDYPYALQHASIILKNNKSIVMECVKQNGCVLKFASVDLQNDKDIVLNAVKQNGLALNYASVDLQNDKEIILAAIK